VPYEGGIGLPGRLNERGSNEQEGRKKGKKKKREREREREENAR